MHPCRLPSGLLEEPLSHSAFFVACGVVTEAGGGASALRVQVRKRIQDETVVLCGQVIELDATDAEWFRVRTPLGIVWAQPRNVRLCTGDGRCICEPNEGEENQKC